MIITIQSIQRAFEHGEKNIKCALCRLLFFFLDSSRKILTLSLSVCLSRGRYFECFCSNKHMFIFKFKKNGVDYTSYKYICFCAHDLLHSFVLFIMYSSYSYTLFSVHCCDEEKSIFMERLLAFYDLILHRSFMKNTRDFATSFFLSLSLSLSLSLCLSTYLALVVMIQGRIRY